MDYPTIPQFRLDFLLRSITYLKEHPPTASTANFPQAPACGETGLDTLHGAN